MFMEFEENLPKGVDNITLKEVIDFCEEEYKIYCDAREELIGRLSHVIGSTEYPTGLDNPAAYDYLRNQLKNLLLTFEEMAEHWKDKKQYWEEISKDVDDFRREDYFGEDEQKYLDSLYADIQHTKKRLAILEKIYKENFK